MVGGRCVRKEPGCVEPCFLVCPQFMGGIVCGLHVAWQCCAQRFEVVVVKKLAVDFEGIRKADFAAYGGPLFRQTYSLGHGCPLRGRLSAIVLVKGKQTASTTGNECNQRPAR